MRQRSNWPCLSTRSSDAWEIAKTVAGMWIIRPDQAQTQLSFMPFRRSLLLALLLLQQVPVVQAADWGGAVGATSDFAYRGLTLSDNKPSGQIDLHYFSKSGWFAGATAASVQRSRYDSTSLQIDAYAGYAWTPTDPWSLRLFGVHHDDPWNNPSGRYNYDELSGTVAYADRLSLSMSVLPDLAVESQNGWADRRVALTYDAAFHQPLIGALSANAGVGYYDLRWVADTGYVYWNAGLAYDFGKLELDLSYIGTDHTARSLFGSVAVNRLVGSLLWHF
ncbi:MAG: hypothetical protein JWR16_2690 [Nevskia sp.]|nr:hypothetical protein [Nevskia sp.]